MQVDYMDLFVVNSPWSDARSHTQVFKLYSQLVLYDPNDSDLETIFTYLNANNLAVAIEVGPLIASATCGQNVEGYGSGQAWAAAMAQRIKSLAGWRYRAPRQHRGLRSQLGVDLPAMDLGFSVPSHPSMTTPPGRCRSTRTSRPCKSFSRRIKSPSA
jgi:hypothetical protein